MASNLDFGPAKLQDAINNLNTNSTKEDLDRYEDRLHDYKDGIQNFAISIRTPELLSALIRYI